ncbi:MAG: DNA-processing protein DprA [Planctomycetota bacterium]|nr:DNA-processing protein DprA [Planctomycetota bacterium]
MALLPEQIPESTLRLLLASGIGPVTLRRLRLAMGSDEKAVDASISDLMQIDRIGKASAESIRRAIGETDPKSELACMALHEARLIMLGDDDYPPLLAVIPDPPSALWIKGQLKDADRLALGIVGSRRCTSYGREQAGRLATLLAQSGLTIVSGGALGIDGEAHRGALRADGRTLVVLGCGLSKSYPSEHETLFERIVKYNGALISEYPMRMDPLAQHFPRRNRIISGLSLGVLVIEAALRSGALITARLALEEHGREVMALPGRVDSPASTGSLLLLQSGGAGLVLDHADVLRQLNDSSHLVRGALEVAGHPDASSPTTLFEGQLTPGQQTIVEVLKGDGMSMLVDQLAAKTGMAMSQLLADLTLLEIRGLVKKDRSGIRLLGGS